MDMTQKKNKTGGTMRYLIVLFAVMSLFAGDWPAQAQEAVQAAESAKKQTRQRTPPPATITFESSVGEVRFPHKTHLKMRCNRCHHQIQAEVLETPHEDYLESSWIRCQTCHADNPELSGKYFKCDQCHHSELENIADETLSAKVVVHKSCWKCHKTSSGADASRNCAFCHDKNQTAEPEETAID